ncbi:hypothetical protein BHMPCIPO_04718 [Ensifer sesbaniae]|nr:hypothetical protein [Ensifer sesbaniae]
MSDTAYDTTPRSILVLSAGELGQPVLRNLARRARETKETTISVLLRASAVSSDDPDKQRAIAEIRELGIEIVVGDLVKSSIDELASLFARYHTVIGCAGYAAGIDTPMKLAKPVAAISASASLRRSGMRRCAQRLATASSTGRIRPANSGRT